MKSRLIMFFISILSIVFIVTLSRSIYFLWQKGDAVTEEELVLQKSKQENQKLKQELDRVKSPEFIEKQAREKLNLQRTGEVVAVLPKNLLFQAEVGQSQPNLPYWLQWYHLFF